MTSRRLALAVAFAAVPGLLPAAAPARADVESDLNARWRGSDVVVRVPVHSACDGFYNDNEVSGAPSAPRVTGGGRAFGAGEAARVERIDAKRNRLDVFLDLAEPVLYERRDGPFTLFDERRCKIQLQVEAPRESLRDTASAEALLGVLLAGAAATDSELWNGRRREDYPEDYEATLAEHAAWKAQQVNAAVSAKLDSVAEDAGRIADRVRRDREYLDGFAAGVEEQRDRHLGDCPALLAASFARRSPPSDGGAEDRAAWERGWDDGQRLAWSLEMLRRLPACFVPVPG